MTSNRESYLSEVENFLRPLLPKNLRVLDWGGDTGVNTPFKAAENCIHVFDISEVSPLPGISSVNFEEALRHQYDLVVCSNVLEHTPHSAATLAEISQVMNENSVLYLEVPYEVHMKSYVTGVERLRAKRHWHEHVNFYTDTALHSLVKRASLSIISFDVKKIVSGTSEFHQFFVACKLMGSK
jgi:SAM-dependent methyltransferase